MEPTGPPALVLEGGMFNPMSGRANFEFSQNGILIYSQTGQSSGMETSVSWMERNGRVTPAITNAGPYDDARLSPDNRSIALTIRAANDDVWVYDISRGTFTRITFGGGNSGLAEWTPDGKRVLFLAERGKETGLFWKPADGSGAIERIGGEASASTVFRPCITPDGTQLAYGANGDLREVSVQGRPEARSLIQFPSTEDAPRFSPDGGLLAYLSDESGRNEIYVVPYPSMDGKWQISTGGADSPAIWNPEGKELFFTEEGRLMKVDVMTAPHLTFSRPQMVCPLPSTLYSVYDITADGRRFLIATADETPDRTLSLNVIVGWFAELEKKVPSRKN
jgi:Tol biopolymer transport system component